MRALLLVVLLSGCSGDVLYAGRFTREQVEPAAEQWRAIGAELNIVYGPVADHSDRIEYVRSGALQAEGRNAESCEKTPTGGIIVVENGLAKTRNVEIDVGCVESGRQTLTSLLVHGLGHYLGLGHLPSGEEGVMAGQQTDGEPEERLTCPDKRLWESFSGTRGLGCD